MVVDVVHDGSFLVAGQSYFTGRETEGDRENECDPEIE